MDYQLMGFHRTLFYLWLAVCETAIRFPFSSEKEYPAFLKSLFDKIQRLGSDEVEEDLIDICNRLQERAQCALDKRVPPLQPQAPLKKILQELGEDNLAWIDTIRVHWLDKIASKFSALKEEVRSNNKYNLENMSDKLSILELEEDLEKAKAVDSFEMFELELGLCIT